MASDSQIVNALIAAAENDRHDESAALAAVEELIPFLYEK